jgi:hypothetical protein
MVAVPTSQSYSATLPVNVTVATADGTYNYSYDAEGNRIERTNIIRTL